MACAGLAIPSARDAGHCGANRFSHAVNRVLSLNALERNYSLRFESLLPAFLPSAAESTKAALAHSWLGPFGEDYPFNSVHFSTLIHLI